MYMYTVYSHQHPSSFLATLAPFWLQYFFRQITNCTSSFSYSIFTVFIMQSNFQHYSQLEPHETVVYFSPNSKILNLNCSFISFFCETLKSLFRRYGLKTIDQNLRSPGYIHFCLEAFLNLLSLQVTRNACFMGISRC